MENGLFFYVTYLINKINFHNKYRDIEGNFSLKEETFSTENRGNLEKLADFLGKMLKSDYSLIRKLLNDKAYDEVKFHAAIICIQESLAMYNLLLFILRKLCEENITNEVKEIINAFNDHHNKLKSCYKIAETIFYIKNNMEIPSLSEESPFEGKVLSNGNQNEKQEVQPEKKVKKKKKKNSKNNQNIVSNPNNGNKDPNIGNPDLIQSLPGGPNPFNLYDNTEVNTIVSQPPVSTQPSFGTYNPPNNTTPFGNFNNPNPTPFGNFSLNTLGGYNNPFLIETSKTQTKVQTEDFNPFNTTNKDTGKDLERAQDMFVLLLSGNSTNYEPQREEIIVVDESEGERLKKKIKDLEEELEKVEGDLAELERRNKELKSQLSDKESGLSNVREELDQKMQLQKQKFMDANRQLRQHIELLMEKYKSEKAQLIRDQIEASKELVVASIKKFNNPDHKGTSNISSIEVHETVDNLSEKIKQMILALTNDGDLVSISKELAFCTEKLLNDSKGASLLISDPSIALQLIQGTQSTAMVVDSLLDFAMNLVGVENINEQLHSINEEFNKVSRQIAVVKQTLTAAENIVQDTSEVDLEDLAERELLNAARIIEEAAAALLSHNNFDFTLLKDDEHNVEAAIMKAVLAITQAVQLLMTAAAEAQQERVSGGKISKKDEGSRYHSDPMWAEGLISCARAVAQSTKELVNSANEATKGNIDDSYLIATANFVQALTTQLVTATKVKSDPNSKSQVKLDGAAKAVLRATRALVEVAQQFALKEEQEIIVKVRSMSVSNSMRFEMEENSKISDLEKKYDQTMQRIKTVRKDKYKK